MLQVAQHKSATKLRLAVSQKGANSPQLDNANPRVAAVCCRAASSSMQVTVGTAVGCAVGAKDGGIVKSPMQAPPAQLVTQCS